MTSDDLTTRHAAGRPNVLGIPKPDTRPLLSWGRCARREHTLGINTLESPPRWPWNGLVLVSLADLTIDDLRCIERAELVLHPGHNLIWGGNGSGKTSLLEAIFLLGRGRSFRTRSSERLIRYSRERLVVFGRTEGVSRQALGVQVSKNEGTSARISGAGRFLTDGTDPALSRPGH